MESTLIRFARLDKVFRQPYLRIHMGSGFEVIKGLWKKWRAFFKPASAGNGQRGTIDPVEVLKWCYRELARLAQQIDSHAARAPYPHVADLLRRLALEKRKCATMLREKIENVHGKPQESWVELKTGKNHWERMKQDLEDQRELQTQLIEHGFGLAEEAPEISQLLKRIASEQASHKEIFLDLLARADPQADQS